MKRVVLALALVGCKADLHQTVDAQPLDTAVDTLSTQGDPPPNAVKLTITRYGDPVENVAVFFQNADSSLVSAALTNANGVAWAIMPAGGFVTAREKTGTAIEQLTTFAGVQASDALELDLAPTGVTTERMLQITVPTDASATSYRIFTPCGEAPIEAPTADIRLIGCGASTDLVIESIDANGDVRGALFQAGVSVDTGTATITGTYAPLGSVHLHYTNVPASVSYVGAYEALSATQRAYGVTAGAPPSANDAQLDIDMPPSSGTGIELTATNLYPVSGEAGQQTIYHWHPATATYDLDVGSVLLPPFLPVAMPARPANFDPAMHVLTWGERAGSLEPEVVRARIHVYRDAIPTGQAWSWRIVAPRTGTSVTYPKLPIVDYDFNPAGGDTIVVDELTTISLPGGFAGFHTHGFVESRTTISGALGRIVEQTLYEEPL